MTHIARINVTNFLYSMGVKAIKVRIIRDFALF